MLRCCSAKEENDKEKNIFHLRNDLMPLDLGVRAFQIVSTNALCRRGYGWQAQRQLSFLKHDTITFSYARFTIL